MHIKVLLLMVFVGLLTVATANSNDWDYDESGEYIFSSDSTEL